MGSRKPVPVFVPTSPVSRPKSDTIFTTTSVSAGGTESKSAAAGGPPPPMLDNCEILLGMFDAKAAASQRGTGSVIHEPEPVYVGGSRGLYPRRRDDPHPRYVRPGFVHEDFVEELTICRRHPSLLRDDPSYMSPRVSWNLKYR